MILNKDIYYKPFPMTALLIFSGWILWGSLCAALFVIVSALAWLNPAFMKAGLVITAYFIGIGVIFSIITAVSCALKREAVPFIKTRFIWMKYFTVAARSVAKRIFLNPDRVVRSYIALNNDFVINEVKGKANPKILILLPHCIQRHACALKLTNDIKNCRRCGGCSVGSLIDISEETGTDIYLASGGTLARKKIKEDMPDVILAVACERDLLSGIRDIMPMPVAGVLNERPEGPCINTSVNLDIINGFLTRLKPERIM